MAGRGRGKKRKSADFICDIQDEDLSTDDENVEGPSCKMSKIDGDATETSKTEENSENPTQDVNKSSKDAKMTSVDESKYNETENATINEEDSTDNQNNEKSKVLESKSDDVIELDDTCDDQDKSVVIIEENVPVLVLSDEEEGEITEDLQIVDEVTATPQSKRSPNKTSPKKKNLEIDDDCNDDFVVIEEVGGSPMPKPKENLFNISFNCEKTMANYGQHLITFLKSYPELHVERNKLSITVHEKETFDETKTPKRKNKKKKKAKKTDDLFVVDTNPSVNDNMESLEFRYNSKFEINEQDEGSSVPSNSGNNKVCFNCDGQHALRDCPIPRNHSRINEARQQFMDKHKTVRYHIDPNQKMDGVEPGVISENLRQALGLKKNAIPDYIYKMRKLGYPPGWLEEAKVAPSDLTMFNIDGQKVENRTAHSTIDPDKIIEYPGFNVPLKKGFYDDFKRHHVKPYSKAMHKSTMIKHYEELYQKEYEQTANKINQKTPEKDSNNRKGKEREAKVNNESAVPVDATSLVDLEEKKKELIDQLNINTNEKPKSLESEGEVSQDSFECNDEKKDTVVAVKNTVLSTPISKSSSPYGRLPNLDNFSVGVSPVINFENLPNSTGVYEKLSKVLDKVRVTMKDIYTE